MDDSTFPINPSEKSTMVPEEPDADETGEPAPDGENEGD